MYVRYPVICQALHNHLTWKDICIINSVLKCSAMTYVNLAFFTTAFQVGPNPPSRKSLFINNALQMHYVSSVWTVFGKYVIDSL